MKTVLRWVKGLSVVLKTDLVGVDTTNGSPQKKIKVRYKGRYKKSTVELCPFFKEKMG